MKMFCVNSIVLLIGAAIILFVSCANDNIESQQGGLSYSFQLKYDSTVVLYSSKDQPVFKVSFVRIVDQRCGVTASECSTCYSNGKVYVYFLVKDNYNNADTLKLSRPGCVMDDFKIGNANMDVESSLGQKFGLVNVVVNPPSPISLTNYTTKLILLP